MAKMTSGGKSLKGSQTEKNLLTSFAGESQARNRYTYFASQARKEGYMQISAIFTETAEQEKEHAKRMFKFLEGGQVEIQASYPAGIIDTTVKNLEEAAEGEHYENRVMYPGFAKIAEKEGFKEVAAMYRAVSVSEKRHETRYRKLIENMNKKQVFARPRPVRWVCRNCGYVHVGNKAPKTCPACQHPQDYFELDGKNY